MNSLDNTFKSYFPFLQNDIFTVTVSIILILYTVLVIPNLSESMSMLFDNPIIKFLLFILIAYISRFNATLALVMTIAVVVSMMRMYQFKEIKNTMANVTQVGYPIGEVNIPPRYNILDSGHYTEKDMSCGVEKALGCARRTTYPTEILDSPYATDDGNDDNNSHMQRHGLSEEKIRYNDEEKLRFGENNLPFVDCNGKNGDYMEGVKDYDESESKYADYEYTNYN